MGGKRKTREGSRSTNGASSVSRTRTESSGGRDAQLVLEDESGSRLESGADGGEERSEDEEHGFQTTAGRDPLSGIAACDTIYLPSNELRDRTERGRGADESERFALGLLGRTFREGQEGHLQVESRSRVRIGPAAVVRRRVRVTDCADYMMMLALMTKSLMNFTFRELSMFGGSLSSLPRSSMSLQIPSPIPVREMLRGAKPQRVKPPRKCSSRVRGRQGSFIRRKPCTRRTDSCPGNRAGSVQPPSARHQSEVTPPTLYAWIPHASVVAERAILYVDGGLDGSLAQILSAK